MTECVAATTNRVDLHLAGSISSEMEPHAERVYEINPLTDPRWDIFINGHTQSSVFHSTGWLRALQIAYGYEPVVVTTCSPETTLRNGLVFCRIKSWLTGKRLVSLPFSDHSEPLADNSTQIDNLLFEMKRRINIGGWKYIELRPTFFLPGEQTGLQKSVGYSLHRLDLRPSTTQLFRNLHKSCVQRKIRRAEREKLQYEEGRSDNLLKQFYALLLATRRRQCLPPQPLSWFRALIDAFGENLKIRVASKNSLPIASILTLSHKKSMVYKYGCSDARFHRLGGMALLFWNTIQQAKDEGFEELEMGRSENTNLGLISFKEHWGAVGRPLNYWTYPYSPYMTSGAWNKTVLRCVVPACPDAFLSTVGELLYRHIG